MPPKSCRKTGKKKNRAGSLSSFTGCEGGGEGSSSPWEYGLDFVQLRQRLRQTGPPSPWRPAAFSSFPPPLSSSPLAPLVSPLRTYFLSMPLWSASLHMPTLETLKQYLKFALLGEEVTPGGGGLCMSRALNYKTWIVNEATTQHLVAYLIEKKPFIDQEHNLMNNSRHVASIYDLCTLASKKFFAPPTPTWSTLISVSLASCPSPES